ncbi:MAG: metal-dependent hydrolase [Acidimicrobiales bacterium]|nr:metal-dependent hydrolase [Acidimicrobiales bacterium]
MPSTESPSRTIVTRRISFEETVQSLPKHFAEDGDLIGSHLVAVLSSVFPDGEDYFVRSVRHFRDEITDPELKRQVAGFIGQEAVHGREHRMLNERLDELGYPAKRIERFVRWGLGFRERVSSPKANLATTAALEHYTATLAEVLMREEVTRRALGAPEMQDVFLWHALEECEHKAVAFDVYKAVGGTERMRRVVMNMITFQFIFGIGTQTIFSVLRDRETYRRGRLRTSIRRLRENPLFTRDVWRRLRDYNRPDFHPDDHETDELLEEWRTALFGEHGRLNHMVAGAAA